MGLDVIILFNFGFLIGSGLCRCIEFGFDVVILLNFGFDGARWYVNFGLFGMGGYVGLRLLNLERLEVG